jgi:hypothetical protein
MATTETTTALTTTATTQIISSSSKPSLFRQQQQQQQQHRRKNNNNLIGTKTLIVVLCVIALVLICIINVQFTHKNNYLLVSSSSSTTSGSLSSLSFFLESAYEGKSKTTSAVVSMESTAQRKERQLERQQSSPFVTAFPYTQSSSYAYMFLIGGIDPDQPKGYLGFLYNVLISSEILRNDGSTADIWLFVQMHPTTNRTTLPVEEQNLLRQLNIATVYLEKPKYSSFADIMMEKFRLLQLVQYKRVMYLDADVLP